MYIVLCPSAAPTDMHSPPIVLTKRRIGQRKKRRDRMRWNTGALSALHDWILLVLPWPQRSCIE